MKGFAKTMVSFGCIALGVGIVLTVVGLVLGGRPQGLVVHWNNGPKIERADMFSTGGLVLFGGRGASDHSVPAAPEPPLAPSLGRVDVTASATIPATGEIHSLDFSMGGADIEIVTGDDFSVEVSGTNNYTEKLENGVWKLEYENYTWRKDVRFTVTIPAGVTFQEIELELGAGTLTAQTLTCNVFDADVGAGKLEIGALTVAQKCDISMSAGTVTIDGALAGEVSIECGAGKLEMNLVQPASYGYDIECGMGSVTIGDERYTGLAVDTTKNLTAPTVYDIKCGMGTVDIAF